MQRWMWWTALGVVGFLGCGGSSMRRSPGGDDDSSGGGTSGSSGASAATGNVPTGGAQPSTGGHGGGGSGGIGTSGSGGSPRGGSGMTGGRGGSAGRGGQAGRGGDAGAGGDAGTGGDAGAGGAPTCDDALPGGSTCSFEQTCEALDCGQGWSLYDAEMCMRRSCTDTGACGQGERCVAAPVAGRFVDHCSNEADSCREGDSECECIYYEECSPSAVCLTLDEFPPERDCPIAGLDCKALERVRDTLQAYIEGHDFFFEYDPPPAIAASLEACALLVSEELESCD